eukprot:6200614-Pleurochrysis_carterae.AAC.3
MYQVGLPSSCCYAADFSASHSDKCGDDSLNLPAGGNRLSSANQSSYTYRISLQASHISLANCGSYRLFCPSMVKTGANFQT